MLTDFIDIYCERTAAGLFNEPLNAVSNLAFFIAAWMLWKHYKLKSPRKRGNHRGEFPHRKSGEQVHSDFLPPPQAGEVALLILLIPLVGSGSLLFHTFATEIAMLSDVVPIGLFVCSYLWISLRRLLNWNIAKRVAVLALFIAATAWLMRLPPEQSFNGSAGYFPCLAYVIFLAFARKHRGFGHVALWLAISLTFRTLDMAVCPILPVGVHFLWHICNGVVLYLLTSAVISPLQGGKDRVE